MKPTKIKRLISLPGYEHVSLEAEIEPFETLQEADERLRIALESLRQSDEQRTELVGDVKLLRHEKEVLKNDCEAMKDFIKEMKDFFNESGVEFDKFLNSDIPF